MKTKPILSFCIPTRNRAQRVYKCVKHILQIESNEIEVIVSDNASTDNTLELLNTISDNRLTIYRNDENIELLNWPLVISYATGSWAALMSDEDEVNLDKLRYFLDLLPKADSDDIGVIIYSFPPIFSYDSEYVCKDQLESLSLGSRHSGHITAHILNMRFFELGVLEDYNKFLRMYDNLEIREPKLTAEPQHEVLLRIAQNHTVMFTKVSLCLFGKDELKNATKLDRGALEVFKDLGYGNVERIVEALYHRTLLQQQTIPVTPENNYQYTSAFMSQYEQLILITLEHFISIHLGDHKYRPALYALAKKEMPITRDEAKRKTLDKLDLYMKYCTPNINTELFETLRRYTEIILLGDPNQKLDDKLCFKLRVLLGNTLFIIYLNSISYTTSKRNQKGFYKVGYFDDIDDILSTKQTHKMMMQLKRRHYSFVINEFNSVTTFRSHYIRGLAHFMKRDYRGAKTELDLFIKTVESPLKISDILTGAFSVQSAYYYLGYICQKQGEHCKAVGYFAKCNDLTNDLMLGWNLSSKKLRLPE